MFMREYQGWDEWADKYKPIKNTIKPSNELMFETYGEEVEFVQSQDPRYVWTSVQGDMSDLIVAGYAYVNRLCYYITEVPWESEDEYVLISVEKECECYDHETDEGKEDCKVCEGYGLVTEYVG
jgi:hypothetical protein